MSRNEFAGVPYAPRATTKEIIFIRHAESEANVDGLWHGRTDGPLSGVGEASLEALGRRLSGWEFDVVISSPLTRARRTAEAVSDEVVVDEEFIEMDVGRWEGLSFEETERDRADELRASFEDWTVPMGTTGESLADVGRRAYAAVDRVFARLGDNQRAVVVTHGGLLQSLLHGHLPGKGRRVHPIVSNTSITRILWQFGRSRLASLNDTAHLGPRSRTVEYHLTRRTPVLALVRHGRTQANTERRWQGHGDWDLDEVGTRQAEALGEWYGRASTVYSSPLRRAISTAEKIALNGIVPVEGLKEMNMGEWEGLTSEEIMEGWPSMMETIYRQGVDLRRGITGESWGELTARVANTIEGIEPAEGEPTVLVAHGGAIRSYVSSLTATDDAQSESLFTPANTSVTHVALTPHGPELIDYSVAAHLESLDLDET
jgi:broad specificity phosphatase PhoE